MSKRHGYYYHQNYKRWYHINERCHDPHNKQYDDYGARGIAVCPEWRKEAGPRAFCDYLDSNLGACPKGMTLDRIDNDGNYEPGNVQWATRSEQNRNRRAFKKASLLPVNVFPSGKRFQARICVSGKVIALGTYDTPDEAAGVVQQSVERLGLLREEARHVS